MSDAVRRLGVVSREYEAKANESEEIYVAAAEAEAEHKRVRSRSVVTWKETEGVRSISEAEYRADASDEVAELYRDRLVKSARSDAHRGKLAQMREQVAVGRTSVVDERAADQSHQGWST